jgi:hypothetical protein
VSIRSSDFAGGAGPWTGAVDAPSTPTPSAAESLFDGAAAAGDIRITADAGSGQRGLTVAEHAERVLSLLRGDGGQR